MAKLKVKSKRFKEDKFTIKLNQYELEIVNYLLRSMENKLKRENYRDAFSSLIDLSDTLDIYTSVNNRLDEESSGTIELRDRD